MRYDKDGTSLICRPCYAKKYQQQAQMKHVALGKAEREKQLAAGLKRVHYICTMCGYRFTKHENYKFWQKCPYCEKDTVRVDVSKSADDIVREAGNMETAMRY